jgi:hypothetical protein
VIIIFNGQIFAKVNYSNQKITSTVLILPQILHRKNSFYLDQQQKNLIKYQVSLNNIIKYKQNSYKENEECLAVRPLC